MGSPEATGSPCMVADGRTFSYLIHDASASGGSVITVTQGDIRAIQLAKSLFMQGAPLNG